MNEAFASLDELNAALLASEPLVPGATRAVLGEGPIGAAVAFVGEQPGDEEDLAGHPFVGPAGKLLDGALEEAGIPRARVYVTNAVKHFKFKQRGKRRIHEKPTAGDVAHYRGWLERELAFVHPHLIVALGATAGLALAGRQVSVLRERGPLALAGQRGYLTVHPSYLLRMPNAEARHAARAAFLADLAAVKQLAAPFG